jgi:hypothetical protein
MSDGPQPGSKPRAPLPTYKEHRPLGVSLREAQRLSGLGRSSIYALISAGTLRSKKVNGRRIIVYESLEEVIAD